jgi:PcfJ-like protein
MHKERSFRGTANRWLDDAIHAAFSLADHRTGAPDAYHRLLRHVRQRTGLLRAPCDPQRLGRGTGVNAGLFALALHHADWLRPVEAWEPPRAGFTPQFASLASHLLALDPVPACMTSAWFVIPPGEPHPEQEWYKHLGRGHSIRTASLPVPFTRAMAHHLGQAPHHYPVKAAVRWAQVRGLGGPEELARAVAATRLGREFAHEDFWLTVLRFFVHAANLKPAHVGPIVDFLYAQRFGTREVFVPGQGIVWQGPPRPDYAVKGRTVASLLRQVEEWHRQLGLDTRMRARSWSRSRVGEFRYVEGTEQQDSLRCWTIRELLTSGELFLEGQAMRHCVASYLDHCASRMTSIWSMQVDTGHGPRRSLTVEVDPARKAICQARGRGNRLPRQAEREILERWAKREGLQIAESQ